MSINITDNNLLTLREAVQELPRKRRGRTIHRSTIYRWATTGVHGVRLETVKIGGQLYTTIEALERFTMQCSGADTRREKHTPHRRQRAIEQAERRLDELGI